MFPEATPHDHPERAEGEHARTPVHLRATDTDKTFLAGFETKTIRPSAYATIWGREVRGQGVGGIWFTTELLQVSDCPAQNRLTGYRAGGSGTVFQRQWFVDL